MLGKRRGAVLIVVLGVLFILALLATAFVTLQATERQVSRNYLDMVRAKLLAQSGQQDAEIRLYDLFPFRYLDTSNDPPPPWKYWGDDRDEGTINPLPAGKGEPDGSPADRLERTLSPSFAWEDEAVQDPTNGGGLFKAYNLTIDGQPRGFSGKHESGTYGLWGDHYVLRVSDLSGRIYVNDGVDNGRNGSVTKNMERILNILGRLSAVNITDLGTKIMDNRPAVGYQHPNELLRAINYDQAAWERVRPHLTAHAWVDKNVCNPVPLSQPVADRMFAMTGVRYFRGTPTVYRYGRNMDASGQERTLELNTSPPLDVNSQNIRIYGLDQLNTQWIEVVQRAPVNINSATREVLTAVLTDLHGFFLGDRRRNNPAWNGDLYLSFKERKTYSPAGSEGDEYAFLRETMRILPKPAGTGVAGEIYADAIADEIIACRQKKASVFNPAFTYADKAWAGVFKSWDQFNKFVDHLIWISPTINYQNIVTVGLLKDSRDWVVMDYDQENVTDSTGNAALIVSEHNRLMSSRALADVLKANFNPNVHLNEINPDENLFTFVDKTDLLVNSTEFNFLPTGYFEVESLGRVLRPETGTDCRTGNNQIAAQAKVTAIYRFYDLYRETSQKQFYTNADPNHITLSVGAAETNNGRSLEIGPEVDNGQAPIQNEYDGFIQMPTVGSDFHSSPLKPKNVVWRTLDRAGGPNLNSDAMHVHFTLDTDAHSHPWDRREIASRRGLPDETVDNFPDPGVTYPGPYDPTDGPGMPHRICRSFRLRSGRTAPVLARMPMSDLRMDGIYSERHSAPAYYTQRAPWGSGLWAFTDTQTQGTVSFWFKPSFLPEFTGKIRGLFDLGRYHAACGSGVHNFPFSLWFFPAHYNPAISEADALTTTWTKGNADGLVSPNFPDYWANNMGHFKPMSFCYGSKAWHDLPAGHGSHEFGNVSLSMNHRGHTDEPTKPTLLRGHKWMNVTFTWNMATTARSSIETNIHNLYFNGSTAWVPFTHRRMFEWADPGGPYINLYEMHDTAANSARDSKQGEWNHMRLGAPSKISNAAGAPWRSNHSADFTFDEFYVWTRGATGTSGGTVDPKLLWLRGRYYNYHTGGGTGAAEPQFTSNPFTLEASLGRSLTPASTTAVAPTVTGGTPPPAPTSGSTPPTNSTVVRVLGLQWTWVGEPLDPLVTPFNTWDGKPVIYDYSTPDGRAGFNVVPEVLMSLKDGATATYGPFSDFGFSAIRAADGTVPAITNTTQLQWIARFRLNAATFGSIFLATPVLDDVTVYWDDNRSHMLSYAFDNRAF